VHGSAPTIAGRGIANPMAAALTGVLMLEDLGLRTAAAALERAVVSALAAGVRTPDIGGSATTAAAAARITDSIS
jgi:tartrate dehydrogenase/decarboxylase/D-malate dehydrogenase